MELSLLVAKGAQIDQTPVLPNKVIFKLRRGALIGRSCRLDGRMVCPLFSNFSKREVLRVKCCIKVPGQHRTICVQCTAADISEFTYVQSKSVQNKPSCAVEVVTSVDSRSNV